MHLFFIFSIYWHIDRGGIGGMNRCFLVSQPAAAAAANSKQQSTVVTAVYVLWCRDVEGGLAREKTPVYSVRRTTVKYSSGIRILYSSYDVRAAHVIG